jgi:hypothetical protein
MLNMGIDQLVRPWVTAAPTILNRVFWKQQFA